jgi:hypothetical protein
MKGLFDRRPVIRIACAPPQLPEFTFLSAALDTYFPSQSGAASTGANYRLSNWLLNIVVR